MKIDQRKSPNCYDGRRGSKPELIVCHITDGSYAGAVSWLCNPKSSGSSHYVVSRKGEVVQLVDLKDGAWANGTSTKAGSKLYHKNSTLEMVKERAINANLYTVSIEHEGIYDKTHGALTPEQEAATTTLIKHIRDEVKERFGVDIPLTREGIVGHYEIDPVTRQHCPGELFPFDSIIEKLGK